MASFFHDQHVLYSKYLTMKYLYIITDKLKMPLVCKYASRLCLHEAEAVKLCPIKHLEFLIFYSASLNYEGNQSH